MPLLSVCKLAAGYDGSPVLFGVDLTIHKGELVTLLGRNGMGKSTTVSAILGIVAPSSGEIHFNGRAIHTLSSHQIARLGIGLVPEGRQIFPNLSVRENLIAFAANRANSERPWDLGRVLDLFPPLHERLETAGSLLSGGEQQMLAIGRALMTNPLLLILDEATEGLAPLVRLEIWRALKHLKQAGQSTLVIDKNISVLTQIADRHYVLEKGCVAWSGSSAELRADPGLQTRYLGVN
jgi:branched-chain amino acid transport system ATP-binding protein